MWHCDWYLHSRMLQSLCKSKFTEVDFDIHGLPVNCAIPLPFDQQEAFRGTGTEFTENVAEAKTEDGKVIFWAWERQMYHSASCCPILNATARGRETKKQSSCRVCKAEAGPFITVAANGTRFHQRDCRAIGRCKTLELTQCPICCGKSSKSD